MSDAPDPGVPAGGGCPAEGAGRVVLATGGTSGIGAGVVTAFLAAGDLVYTCGRRAERVRAAVAAAESRGGSGRLVGLVGDVTDAGFRAELGARIEEDAGRLDVLVNNAGTLLAAGDLDEDPDAWRATLEVNLIAPYALIRGLLPLLTRGAAPCVVNISSACAQQPFATCTSTSYSASKAGLDLMTRRLARALASRGIRVNAVAPGVVPSELWGEAADLIEETARRRHVLGGRPVSPEDVAAAVLFLASQEARTVTGAILNVDAGYTLG